MATLTRTPTKDDAVVPTSAPVAAPAVTIHRVRASGLATLSLILGAGAAFLVATGLLAGLGVAMGIVAMVVAVGGLIATSRSHVAGKGDAIMGLFLGLGAIVVGWLAFTGNLSWLDAATNQVTRLHNWLDVRIPWLTGEH
jgi:hypothetical protein